MRTMFLCPALLAGLFVMASAAEAKVMDHAGHAMPAATADAPSTTAFKEANHTMHAAMQQAYTGNADVDFVTGMIPHHQGAVEMAKIVLQYGKDPEVRKLAEAIIKAQQDEIAWMQGWLEKNPQK